MIFTVKKNWLYKVELQESLGLFVDSIDDEDLFLF